MNRELIARIVDRMVVAYPSRYSGDPYWITVKYSTQCAKCHKPIEKGDEAFYYPRFKKLYGEKCGCGTDAANDFQNKVEEEDFYNR